MEESPWRSTGAEQFYRPICRGSTHSLGRPIYSRQAYSAILNSLVVWDKSMARRRKVRNALTQPTDLGLKPAAWNNP